jgi:NADPH2:quinone reductase
MKAIRIHHHGGPEVLQLEEIDIRQPGPGEVLVRNRAIGVNFTDVYSRNGTFPPPDLPFTPGKAGAGEVVSVGAGVTGFAPGDRVAFVETLGAYAEQCVVPEHFLVRLPDAIGFDIAAASLLRGLTAYFLLHRTYVVQPGQAILVQAAAGGVGVNLTQWAKQLGANVIGTVGSPEKAPIARANGCDHVINYRQEEVVARVRDITGGDGCHVVYDSVGKDTFPGSLDCLRPFGYFVSFGLASGPIPPFDIMLLLEKGSLYAAWPGLTMHLAKRGDVLAMSQALFDVIATGVVKIQPPTRLPLADAAEAHRRLESRETTGVMVLRP